MNVTLCAQSSLGISVDSLFEHASQPMIANPTDSVLKYDFHKSNYISIGDILTTRQSLIVQQTGDPLHYSTISFANSLSTSSVMSFNGVPLHSGFSQSMDLNAINPESVHKISIFTGMDASILGGTSGAYLYMQENQYSSSKPFSRLWYVQGGYDLIGTEGVFTQNIDSTTNIHASYRRISSTGMLRNSGGDIWNTRLGIRKIYSKDITASLQWLFANQGSNHNGGIIGQYETPLNAQILFDDYFDRTYSHTVLSTLTIRNVFTPRHTLLINAYAGNTILESRGVNPYILPDSNLVLFSPYFRIGMNARYEMPRITENLSLIGEIGFQQENAMFLNRYEHHRFQSYMYLYGTYALSSTSVIRGGIRGTMNRNTAVNYGVSFTQKLNDKLEFQANYSKTYSEPGISTQMIAKDITEITDLFFVSMHYSYSTITCSLQPFLRKYENSHVLSMTYNGTSQSPQFSELKALPISTFESKGLSASVEHKQGTFLIGSTISYTNQQEPVRFTPTFSGTVYSEYGMNFGSSTVSFGLNFRFVDTPTTMRFVPYLDILAHDTMGMDDTFQWNGLDIHISAILGNARIRASLLNVFSRQLVDIAAYPIQDNVIRISLNWSFFD